MSVIKCPYCHKVLFDGLILRIRVGQFSGWNMNLKCSQCKNWIEGLDVRLLIEQAGSSPQATTPRGDK